MRKVTATLRDAVLATLYPATCRVCGAMIESWRDGVACHACWRDGEEKIEQVRAQQDFCAKCGMPLTTLSALVFTGERTCGRCNDLAFDFARACGIYEGALRENVLWMKFHPQLPHRLRPQLQTVFADLNAKQPVESILPVPLHADRLAARTFNQAEVIARKLAALTGLRVDAASLVRARHTEKHRAGMGARERARSLEKAFRVRAPRLIEGKSVLLVDDVMTTGSTAHAIAEVLLAGGACSVSVLTLARAANEFA
ncbi:MAG TPA: ComF family protein [Blastocatellia bacterium]|nr:ComF family protein [Blastocatellia bacterium]